MACSNTEVSPEGYTTSVRVERELSFVPCIGCGVRHRVKWRTHGVVGTVVTTQRGPEYEEHSEPSSTHYISPGKWVEERGNPPPTLRVTLTVTRPVSSSLYRSPQTKNIHTCVYDVCIHIHTFTHRDIYTYGYTCVYTLSVYVCVTLFIRRKEGSSSLWYK